MENEYEIHLDEMRVIWHRTTFKVKASCPQEAEAKARAHNAGIACDGIAIKSFGHQFEHERALSLREGQLLTDLRDSEGEPIPTDLYREYSKPKLIPNHAKNQLNLFKKLPGAPD